MYWLDGAGAAGAAAGAACAAAGAAGGKYCLFASWQNEINRYIAIQEILRCFDLKLAKIE